MCLTVPCRVLAVDGVRARVARGDEIVEASLELFTGVVEPGDWVAVQAQRYVFARLSEQEAREILDVYERLGRELNGEAAFEPTGSAPLPLPQQFAFGGGPDAPDKA